MRVLMTHPDLQGEVKSFLSERAEWLRSRDARWQVVESTSPLKNLKHAGNETGIEKTIGGTKKKKGDCGCGKK